jgi:hypothetical protein
VGSETVWPCKWILACRRNMLPQSSGLKTACFSKMVINHAQDNTVSQRCVYRSLHKLLQVSPTLKQLTAYSHQTKRSVPRLPAPSCFLTPILCLCPEDGGNAFLQNVGNIYHTIRHHVTDYRNLNSHEIYVFFNLLPCSPKVRPPFGLD